MDGIKRPKLNSGAIPTIFDKSSPKSSHQVKGTQTTPAKIQLSRSAVTIVESTPQPPFEITEHTEEDMIEENRNRIDDGEWQPNCDDDSSDAEDDQECAAGASNTLQERKYLVFESMLMTFFTVCNICLSPFSCVKKSLHGSMLQVETECTKGHRHVWYSQPRNGKLAWGNISLAASCFFSGCQPSKMFRLFRHLNMASIDQAENRGMVSSVYHDP
eukprot:gene13245-14605_t